MPHSARVVVVSIEVVVAAAAVALAVGVPIWRYAVHRWEVTDTFIVTRSGAIFRDWRIVPLHRVQTVEVSQGILERAFGVARLVVRTASYAGSTEVPGMDAAVARQVADGLTIALAGQVRAGHGDDGADVEGAPDRVRRIRHAPAAGVVHRRRLAAPGRADRAHLPVRPGRPADLRAADRRAGRWPVEELLIRLVVTVGLLGARSAACTSGGSGTA